jgi:hypothetical protein
VPYTQKVGSLSSILRRHKLASKLSAPDDFVFASNTGTALNPTNVRKRGSCPTSALAACAELCDGGVVRSPAMGRIAIALVAASVLSIGADPAVSSLSVPSVQGDCLSSELIVLFWPQGHSAIPRYGISASTLPHADVYYDDTASNYLTSETRIAYAGIDRKWLSESCRREKDTRSFAVDRPVRTIKAKGNIVCGARHVQIRTFATGRVRSELRLIEPPNRLVLSARLARSGSTLSYATRRCHMAPVPR